MHAESFVEELRREDNDAVRVLRKSLNIDCDISSTAEDVLSPVVSRIEATLRMFEPDELSMSLMLI